MMRSGTLLLLLLAPGALCGHTCPPASSACECVWSGGKLTLECSRRGLLFVPVLEDDGKDTFTATVTVGKFANNNNLSLADKLASYGYRDVQELYFKMCNIGEVPEHIFEGLSNLLKLDLSSNRISRIEVKSFDDLRHLKILDLSHNKLSTLDHRSLTGLPNLRSLDLGSNLLAVLIIPGLSREEKSNQTLDKLSSISLEGNPWRCDCQLGPLHRDLTARGLVREDVRCSDETGGAHWTEMAPNNFTCSPYLTRIGAAVGFSLCGVILLGLVTAGLCVFWRKKLLKKTKNVNSFELLNSSLTLPPMRKEHLNSPVNPLPKPPRTGLYGDAFSRLSVATTANDSLVMLTGQDELNCNYIPSPHMMFSRPPHSDTSTSFVSWLDNRPGSRASLVTISSVVSSPPVSELPPQLVPLVHSHSHPPHQSRPGYVTLPRKVKPRPQLDSLGPRTSADGSSLTNINKMTLPAVKFTPSQPAALDDSGHCGAPAGEVRGESPPLQRSLLDPIMELEQE